MAALSDLKTALVQQLQKRGGFVRVYAKMYLLLLPRRCYGTEGR